MYSDSGVGASCRGVKSRPCDRPSVLILIEFGPTFHGARNVRRVELEAPRNVLTSSTVPSLHPLSRYSSTRISLICQRFYQWSPPVASRADVLRSRSPLSPRGIAHSPRGPFLVFSSRQLPVPRTLAMRPVRCLNLLRLR